MSPITDDTHCYIAVRPHAPDVAKSLFTLSLRPGELATSVAADIRRGLVIRLVTLDEGRAAIQRGFAERPKAPAQETLFGAAR